MIERLVRAAVLLGDDEPFRHADQLPVHECRPKLSDLELQVAPAVVNVTYASIPDLISSGLSGIAAPPSLS